MHSLSFSILGPCSLHKALNPVLLTSPVDIDVSPELHFDCVFSTTQIHRDSDSVGVEASLNGSGGCTYDSKSVILDSVNQKPCAKVLASGRKGLDAVGECDQLALFELEISCEAREISPPVQAQSMQRVGGVQIENLDEWAGSRAMVLVIGG